MEKAVQDDLSIPLQATLLSTGSAWRIDPCRAFYFYCEAVNSTNHRYLIADDVYIVLPPKERIFSGRVCATHGGYPGDLLLIEFQNERMLSYSDENRRLPTNGN